MATLITDWSPDCLAHVFSFLPLRDLKMVNTLCNKMHNAIVTHRSHKYHSCMTHVDIGLLFRRYDGTTDFKVDFIRDYLTRFGNIIKELKFEMNGYETEHDRVFNFIIGSCSNALKSLHMCNIKLDLETISKGQLLLSYLENLEVEGQFNLCPLLRPCVNLRELRLTCSIDYQTRFDLTCTLPRLQVFALKFNNEECIKHDQEIPGLDKALDYFFQQHPNLISLSLRLPYPLNIDLIAQLTNLEEIYLNGSLQFETLNLAPLCELSSLQKMEIDGFYDYLSSEFLTKSEAKYILDRLTLDLVTIENVGFLEGLSRFRTLRYLSLSIFKYTELPDTTWEKLQNLYDLLELRLSEVDQNNVGSACRKFIKYLSGAHESLEKFSINVKWSMTNDFIGSLAPFECLHTLELDMEMDDIEHNLGAFSFLTSLKELILISKQSILLNSRQQNVINHFNSLMTLEKLEFRNFSNDGVFVRNSVTLQFEKM